MLNSYIVCYDIADAKRLRKVLKTCRNHGDHLQYSVFECDLNATEKMRFEKELEEIIDREKDQVLFIALGPSANRGERVVTSLGFPYVKVDAPCYVF